MGTANSTLQEGVPVEDIDYRRTRPSLAPAARVRIYDPIYSQTHHHHSHHGHLTAAQRRRSLRSVQSSPALTLFHSTTTTSINNNNSSLSRCQSPSLFAPSLSSSSQVTLNETPFAGCTPLLGRERTQPSPSEFHKASGDQTVCWSDLGLSTTQTSVASDSERPSSTENGTPSMGLSQTLCEEPGVTSASFPKPDLELLPSPDAAACAAAAVPLPPSPDPSECGTPTSPDVPGICTSSASSVFVFFTPLFFPAQQCLHNSLWATGVTRADYDESDGPVRGAHRPPKRPPFLASASLSSVSTSRSSSASSHYSSFYHALESFGVPQLTEGLADGLTSAQFCPLAEHLMQDGLQSTIPFPAMREVYSDAAAEAPRPRSFNDVASPRRGARMLRKVSQWSLSSFAVASSSRMLRDDARRDPNSSTSPQPELHLAVDPGSESAPDSEPKQTFFFKAPLLRARRSEPLLSRVRSKGALSSATTSSGLSASERMRQSTTQAFTSAYATPARESPLRNAVFCSSKASQQDLQDPFASPLQVEQERFEAAPHTDNHPVGAEDAHAVGVEAFFDPVQPLHTARERHRRSRSVNDVLDLPRTGGLGHEVDASALSKSCSTDERSDVSIPNLPHLDSPNLSSYPPSPELMQASWASHKEQEPLEKDELAAAED